MSTSFDDLIRLPEPPFLNVVHTLKVALAFVAFIGLLFTTVGTFFGIDPNALFAAIGLFGLAIIVGLIANRASERLFVQRAMDAGLSRDEARRFWRTYDWDEQ